MFQPNKNKSVCYNGVENNAGTRDLNQFLHNLITYWTEVFNQIHPYDEPEDKNLKSLFNKNYSVSAICYTVNNLPSIAPTV